MTPLHTYFAALGIDLDKVHPAAEQIIARIESKSFEQSLHRIYGDLLRLHLQAFRAKDEARQKRLLDAIELLRELYPEAVAAWDERHGGEPQPKGQS